MKNSKLWLSKPIYESIPIVFVLGALALFQISESNVVSLFGIYLIAYSLYITACRILERDSIEIDCHENPIPPTPASIRRYRTPGNGQFGYAGSHS